MTALKEAVESGEKKSISEAVTARSKSFRINECSSEESLASMWSISKKIKDGNLAKELLSSFNIRSLDVSNISSFFSLASVYGNNWCYELLKKWYSNSKFYDLYSFIDHFHFLAKASLKSDTQFWLKPMKEFFKLHIDSYFEKSLEEKKLRPISFRDSEEGRLVKGVFLLKNALLLSDKELSKDIMKFFFSHPDLFSPEGLMKILSDLPKANSNHTEDIKKVLQNHLKNRLEKLVSKGLRKASDWSLNVKIPCNSDDCKKVSSF